MKAKALLPVSCLLLAGCVSVGRSELANDTAIEQIGVGETIKQQVARLLANQRVSGASKCLQSLL